MGTTVDDLIDLKDNAVEVAYNAVETVLSVFGENPEGAMGSLLAQARAVVERDELYDKADASDAVSIEDYEANYPPAEGEAENYKPPAEGDRVREGARLGTVMETNGGPGAKVRWDDARGLADEWVNVGRLDVVL